MIKCDRCGADIPDGSYECPSCGQAVQLVPNYEMLDLEMFFRQNNTQEKKVEALQERHEARRKQNRMKKLLTRLCAFAIAAVAAIFVIFTVFTIRSSMDVSADDQFGTALSDAKQMYEDGDYQEAYNAVCTALEYDEDNEEALILKAQIAYFGLDNKDEAVSILRNLIAADSECEDAYQALLDLYADAGEYDIIAELMDSASANMKQTFADYIVPVPALSVDEGTYNEDQSIEMNAQDGCEIYYTTDAEAGFDDYILYEDALELTEGEASVNAVAVNAKGIRSKTVSKTYKIVYDVPNQPEFATASGTYQGDDDEVTINTVEGATIYYAVDAKPTTSSAMYAGPIKMQEGKHFVYAIAVNARGISSPISAIWYEYTAQTSQSSGNTYNSGSSSSGNRYSPSSSGNNSGSSSTTPTETVTPTPTETTTPSVTETPNTTPSATPTATPEPEPSEPEPSEPEPSEPTTPATPETPETPSNSQTEANSVQPSANSTTSEQ